MIALVREFAENRVQYGCGSRKCTRYGKVRIEANEYKSKAPRQRAMRICGRFDARPKRMVDIERPVVPITITGRRPTISKVAGYRARVQ